MVEAKVAQILTDREIVITAGAADGVAQGMVFAILAPTPLEIRHPDTGEVLGVVDREKLRVKATDVHEKLAVCSTYRTRTVGGGVYYNAMRGLTAAYDAPRTIRETIKAAEFPQPLSEDESYVKIGDRVREVTRDQRDAE